MSAVADRQPAPTTAVAAALLILAAACGVAAPAQQTASARPRVIVTTDGEADDRCSMVRFLLTANEFDVEAIVNSSSQFHWQGGEGWNAFHPVTWVSDQLDRYAEVFPSLRKHDPGYPAPDDLRRRWKVGNISAVGERETRTEGAELIAEVLLDDSDPRPIHVQAWGGCNTIARALEIIREDHPARMLEVADRLRLFLIWEQDATYQEVIRPHWEPLGVMTIISDQFDCMAYIWPKVLPAATRTYLEAPWMQAHILSGHGPLCASYEHKDGAFHAEGDTPAFLHAIPNGLRSAESPAWGGWGGRYVKVRHNVWMDPPPHASWRHPEGRWSIDQSWSKQLEHATDPELVAARTRYFEPIWRWLAAVQNDFAARADWCVRDFADANHHPIVRLRDTPLAIDAAPGAAVTVDATPTTDPDGDELAFRWWHYAAAGSYRGRALPTASTARAQFTLPRDARPGDTIHLVCEVTDAGEPPLTRYRRVVVRVTRD